MPQTQKSECEVVICMCLQSDTCSGWTCTVSVDDVFAWWRWQRWIWLRNMKKTVSQSFFMLHARKWVRKHLSLYPHPLGVKEWKKSALEVRLSIWDDQNEDDFYPSEKISRIFSTFLHFCEIMVKRKSQDCETGLETSFPTTWEKDSSNWVRISRSCLSETQSGAWKGVRRCCRLHS